jgi:hypothetical protein
MRIPAIPAAATNTLNILDLSPSCAAMRSPILFSIPLHSRRVRVFALYPMPSLQACWKIVGPSFSICSLNRNAWRRPAKQYFKSCLAHFERVAPHVFAVYLDQIERTQEESARHFCQFARSCTLACSRLGARPCVTTPGRLPTKTVINHRSSGSACRSLYMRPIARPSSMTM